MLPLLLALQAATASPPDLSAVQRAAVSAAMAASPQACSTVPASDTLTGTVGSGCYAPGNATRPTVVQAAQTTTDASAAWSVTWKRSFQSTTPYVHAEPIAPGLPINCTVTTATAAAAAGKCYQTTTTTLGGTITAIQGTVVSPVVNAGANLDIRVIGRETTQ